MAKTILFWFVAVIIGIGFVELSSGNAQMNTVSIEPKTFKVEQDSRGKFWFVDPQQHKFLSIGINNVVPSPYNPRPNTTYYDAVNTVFGGDFTAWKTAVFSLLQNARFNTLGAWSDARLYDGPLYGTICLYVAGHTEYNRCLSGFQPDFEQTVRKNVQDVLSKYKSTDNVLGFYLDNEMPWFGKSGWDDIPNYTLLEAALDLSPDNGAYKAAKAFLTERYKDPNSFSKAWGQQLGSWDKLDVSFVRKCQNDQTKKDRDDFAEIAADKFLGISSKVVRELAPGKLILGVRFAGRAPDSVIKACGRHCDVISFNNYQVAPKANIMLIARYWINGKKPLMVTEYSWRATENTSGNPNTRGAGTVLQTQAQRASHYTSYVEDMVAYPMIIGLHWFEFADQSPQGRFDGEDSDYGIVDIRHRPYHDLLDAMTMANAKVSLIHEKSTRQIPDNIADMLSVKFEPGQHPERPASIDITKSEAVLPPELSFAPDANITISQAGDSRLINIDTGAQWGCAVVFFGPKSCRVEGGLQFATDLDGYSALLLDATIPANISFELCIDESRVTNPAAGLKGSGTDDGESFGFKTLFGKGQRYVYKFDLSQMLLRTTWGNQQGHRQVNMNSLKGVGIVFPAGQGKGTLKIHAIKFTK
jgi:hypothetical protein